MKLVYCIDSLVASGGTERVVTTKLNWLADCDGVSVWMMDLSTDFCHVKDGNITRMTWIKDFLHTKCQLNFNWKDPMPTVCYYMNKLKSSFAK